MDQRPRRARLHLGRQRKVMIALGAIIALVLSGLGIQSASAATRSRLAVSLNPDRSNAARLDGSTVKGEIYVFVRNSRSLDKVDFYLDGSWRTKPPIRTEMDPPFDFVGADSDGTALPFDTAKLADGSHSIRVRLTWSDGSRSSRRANFTIANSGVTTSTQQRADRDFERRSDADDYHHCAGTGGHHHCSSDYFGSDHHRSDHLRSDHDNSRANDTFDPRAHDLNHDAARSGWILAERAARQDLWQYVTAERTGERRRPGRSSCRPATTARSTSTRLARRTGSRRASTLAARMSTARSLPATTRPTSVVQGRSSTARARTGTRSPSTPATSPSST